MRLTEDERKAMVSLRLDNAKQTLEDAKFKKFITEIKLLILNS